MSAIGLSSCLGGGTAKSTRSGSGGIVNSPSSVSEGHGRILKDNPIILSGDTGLEAGANLSLLITSQQDFITNNQFLVSDCTVFGQTVSNCIETRKDQNSSLTAANQGTWAFDANSTQFLEVNTFAHLNAVASAFHNQIIQAATLGNPGAFQNYVTAIPSTVFSSKGFWRGGKTLLSYADCGQPDNAFFSPATFSLCFGHLSALPSVLFSQDPTVIFHEAGHTMTDLAMNLRNEVNATYSTRSNLGYLFYDEAGSIGEGVADYFSYMMNSRPHFAEWALGRFLNLSRPLREDDPLHAPGLAVAEDSRLSYPTYLLYDPNNATIEIEDVHFAGQIISHYMVALTEDLETQCSMTKATAIKNVMAIYIENMAEMGDISATGNDNLSGHVNLDQANAELWIRAVTPINFRRWAQGMAKYTLRMFSQVNNCNGGSYPRDRIEKLLDSYGLLLFKNYNEDGGAEGQGHAATSTPVTATNRVRTVLIPKDLLKLDPTQNATKAFVIDKRSDMIGALQSLQSTGQVSSISNQIQSDLPFNNGNARISPGELVGVSLNLYNDSNSVMAGIQVLGNDWDHFKEKAPCNTFSDNFPLISEGAAQLTTGEGVPGGCNYTTRSNGGEAAETLAPVCFVQVATANATQWADQSVLMTNTALDSSNCLSGSGKTSDCFIRILAGADNSFHSLIKPKQTYFNSLKEKNADFQFSLSNLIFFEVSPWTPPGTTFNCRFRARYTNCDDCWNDAAFNGDDYSDFEFSGAKPYSIINFQFTVID
ncbi:MAG: hypothetical protein HN509_15170 [Halobacteriovoraceae bacterium]|nr:hypothetical protein [Halobacteriovoraceae bacterium]